MVDTLSTPWDFHNNDKKLFSPDELHKVTYYDLNEIAMGAPLGGQCSLQTSDNKSLNIYNWCGGPPVWQTDGKLVAIPLWIRKFFKGTVQQIGIVDIGKLELTIYWKTFRVLDLRSFEKGIISGYDSPIHKTTSLTFDIENEEYDRIVKLWR